MASTAPWPETDEERLRFVDWQGDVAEGNTTLGFREWLENADEERPRVPDAHITVHGEYNGNAYPETQDYTVTLHANSDSWEVHVESEAGSVVTDHWKLDAGAAEELIRAAHAEQTKWAVSGLSSSVTWEVSDEITDLVRITDLGEVAEWLEYYLGRKTWDWNEQGDTWE